MAFPSCSLEAAALLETAQVRGLTWLLHSAAPHGAEPGEGCVQKAPYGQPAEP